MIGSRSPQTSKVGRWLAVGSFATAETRCPRASTTLRRVARNAPRVAGSPSSRSVLKDSSSNSGPVPRKNPSTRPEPARACRVLGWLTRGSTSSDPGRVAARRNGEASRPSPPLATSTRPAVRSGNW